MDDPLDFKSDPFLSPALDLKLRSRGSKRARDQGRHHDS